MRLAWIGCAILFIMGCHKMDQYQMRKLGFSATADEIAQTCKSEQKALIEKLDTIGKVGANGTFETACLSLERALTQFHQTLSPLMFLKYVSEKPEIRKAAGECETSVEKLQVDVFAREDLFTALKAAAAKKQPLERSDQKLLEEFLLAFKRNGLELSPKEREVFINKRKRLVELETLFSKELIEWKDHVEFTKEELEGMPESYVNRLEKTAEGKYKVTVQYPDYYPFMENAKSAEARKKLEAHFMVRGGEKNKDRLDEALKLRHETANLLGYPNHAAFVLDDRMAKTPTAVNTFLHRVGERLKKKGQEDLKDLIAAKKEDLGEKSDGIIHSHDWRYYDNLVKKRKHHIDMEKIKEYFPLDVVNRGMFEIYETLLGVKFQEDPSLKTWHTGAVPYRVTRDGKTVAIFYMDLFPREGKYGHAAAFTLIQGWRNENGTYETPVSAIVANFSPPSKDRPSLLEHGEVETLFHEFGHIMHQVLTTASHASLSGTSVKRDFVEAPSQMLENWVWEMPTLSKLSGHYKNPTKPLPAEEIQHLVDAKLLHVGLRYLRQLLFATLDQRYHGTPPADSTAVYEDLAAKIMLIPIPKGSLPQAGFGHLMGGYDAGYYGYLWSEVYAQDMFTRFEKEGLLNPKTGHDYLKWILQPGGELEPMALLKHFLGREPNEEAFYKSLGL